MSAVLQLPASMIGEMISHAYEDLPNECCGIITSEEGVASKLHRIGNAEASPFRYKMNQDDVFRVLKDVDLDDSRVLVVYHSHVASRAYPSPTDVLLAQWPGTDAEIFPSAYYVLVSLQDRSVPKVRAFTIRRKKTQRVKLEDS